MGIGYGYGSREREEEKREEGKGTEVEGERGERMEIDSRVKGEMFCCLHWLSDG